jgi:hypothetical protein
MRGLETGSIGALARAAQVIWDSRLTGGDSSEQLMKSRPNSSKSWAEVDIQEEAADSLKNEAQESNIDSYSNDYGLIRTWYSSVMTEHECIELPFRPALRWLLCTILEGMEKIKGKSYDDRFFSEIQRMLEGLAISVSIFSSKEHINII